MDSPAEPEASDSAVAPSSPLGLMGRQLAVGACCFVLNLCLLRGLVAGLGVDILVATVVCFFTMNFIGHAAARRFVFQQSERTYRESLWRYVVVMALNLVANVAAMAWLTRSLGLHYLLASVLMSVAFFFGNFYFHWAWTFALRWTRHP